MGKLANRPIERLAAWFVAVFLADDASLCRWCSEQPKNVGSSYCSEHCRDEHNMMLDIA
jgi:hypothetical protein